MRYLITFIIICSNLLMLNANLQNRTTRITPDTPLKDSLQIFNDITDIEKQLKASSEDFQRSTVSTVPIPPPDSVVRVKETVTYRKNYLDSLYARRANGTLILPNRLGSITGSPRLTFSDTIIINPLYLPMVFTGRMLPEDISFYPRDSVYRYKGTLIAPSATFEQGLDEMRFVNAVRRNYYTQYPDKIKLSVFNFDTIPPTTSDRELLERFNPFREPISAERSASLDAPSVETIEIKRKYWINSGEHRLQFSQNYFSDNWHKGGNNNLVVNNYHVLRANYHKEKVRFDNTFEWRLSMYTTPDDTLRKFNIGDDMIRYYGSLGVDAFVKKWSYSTNLEVKSQLFNNYPANSDVIRSAFLSPLYVNAGVGMRYYLDKRSEKVRNRRVRLTIDMAPFSMNYRYVMNDAVDVKRYGISEGHKSKMEIGTTITMNMKYDITRYVVWDSRLKYFTSYKNVLAEFENTLNMALSQYFSTTLYLHTRFDDSVPRDPKLSYLQVNEMVSFGLNYKW